MDLQQSLKAVKLYLKLVAVRMVSLQLLKLIYGRMIVHGCGKKKTAIKNEKKSSWWVKILRPNIEPKARKVR